MDAGTSQFCKNSLPGSAGQILTAVNQLTVSIHKRKNQPKLPGVFREQKSSEYKTYSHGKALLKILHSTDSFILLK
ncbi:MAG: hypothetical protein WCR72_10790 [Bacteroidota bacterium]